MSLKTLVCADMDAIGYMYRHKDGDKNILSFKSSEQDLATGSRSKHLRNEEFVISELRDDTLVTYWDNIFIQK